VSLFPKGPDRPAVLLQNRRSQPLGVQGHGGEGVDEAVPRLDES
jgi:hypothetical protein